MILNWTPTGRKKWGSKTRWKEGVLRAMKDMETGRTDFVGH
jgi:hypothetical protein